MSDTAMRPFDRSLPMALLRAREAVMGHFRPLLADQGLTEQQWRVLRALSGGPLEVGAVALATSLRPPSLSRIVARLTADGLVRRREVAADLRRAQLALTRRGRATIARVGPRAEATYDELEHRFGRARLGQLTELLDQLAALGPPA